MLFLTFLCKKMNILYNIYNIFYPVVLPEAPSQRMESASGGLDVYSTCSKEGVCG